MHAKPKRAFVRGLFGTPDYSSGERLIQLRNAVENDLKVVLQKEKDYDLNYTTYVCGSANADMLSAMGIQGIRLVDKRPYLFDKQYGLRHKIEFISLAMQEYDEVVWLDWDCNIIKKLPEDFWEKMYARKSFQACLFSYRSGLNRLAYWRDKDQKIVANTGFTYLRDKGFMERVVKAWEITNKHINDEVAFTYALDETMGGWKGAAYYSSKYEPLVARMRGRGACTEEVYLSKDPYFIHYFRC